MKRMFILAAALLAALAISAQEPNKFGLKKPDSPRSGKYELPDSLRNKFELPDSLAHLSPWKPDYRAEGRMKVKPSVTMTSVVVIHKENLPSRVTVIDNNTLRLGRHFTISNGQAWNNGSFPMRSSMRGRSRCHCRGRVLLSRSCGVPFPAGHCFGGGCPPLDPVTRKFAGTEYGALRASIRTGA